MLQCDAVCCDVVQCVAVHCSALQCGAAYCSLLQCGAVCCSVLHIYLLIFFFFTGFWGGGDRLRPDHVIDSTCIAGCCSALHCVAVHCSALHAHMLYLFSGLLLEDFGAVVSVFRGNLFGVEGLGFKV